MENRPVETYCVHDYLRNKLCVLYENDCIFDKFECSWSSNDELVNFDFKILFKGLAIYYGIICFELITKKFNYLVHLISKIPGTA